MVRLTDRPDMTLDVYRGRKTTMQQQQLKTDNTANLRTEQYTLEIPQNKLKGTYMKLVHL